WVIGLLGYCNPVKLHDNGHKLQDSGISRSDTGVRIPLFSHRFSQMTEDLNKRRTTDDWHLIRSKLKDKERFN
ncbi:MAG TPA: hypothetical protein VKA34_08500, partial [Balneolales bacterium]|nr:hypothetical protein [Balneolales bacterium]